MLSKMLQEAACKERNKMTGVTMTITMVFVQFKGPDCFRESLRARTALYSSLFPPLIIRVIPIKSSLGSL